AVSNSPSAVTMSADSRLSQLRPCFPINQPSPPPRVSPAMPVVETTPPVLARPKACVSSVVFAPSQASLGPRGARLRIDPYALHRRQVDHQPALAHGVAGDVVAAAAHREQEPVGAGKTHRRDDVGRPGAAR